MPTHPVIIVPGFMGSKLLINGDQKWPAISRQNILSLKLNQDGSGNQATATDIVREFQAADRTINRVIYRNLIDFLKEHKYVERETLFVFPYDWRQPLTRTARLLQERIETILRIPRFRQNPKVDIIAHSMGGLIARYAAKSESTHDKIRKLLLVATPNHGTPDGYVALTYGLGHPFPRWMTRLPYVADADTFKEILSSMPSIYYLLPSRNYFRMDPNFLSLDTVANRRNNVDLAYRQAPTAVPNQQLLNEALHFHNELGFFSGCKNTYLLVGHSRSTLESIVYDQRNASTYQSPHWGSGDGTVTLKSAEALSDVYLSRIRYYENTEHTELIGNNDVLNDIIAILKGDPSPAGEPPQSSIYKNLRKHALIISGGINSRWNEHRYLNNIIFMYRTLIERYDYLSSNVKIIYADGTYTYGGALRGKSPTEFYAGTSMSTGPYRLPEIIDTAIPEQIIHSALRRNLEDTLNYYSEHLTPQDTLFICIFNHAGLRPHIPQGHRYLYLYSFAGERNILISFDELARQINYAPASKIIIYTNTCYAGGLKVFFNQNNRLVVSSTSNMLPSIGTHKSTADFYDFDEFAFHFLSALYGKNPFGIRVRFPTDTKISIRTGFQYARRHDEWLPPGELLPKYGRVMEDPELFENPSGLADATL